MKILLKTSQAIYDKFTNPNWSPTYIDSLWGVQLKQTFEELGHKVKFIGETAIEGGITNSHEGYDVLIFHELPSFIYTQEYSLKLLKEFKGTKIFFIPTYLAKEYEHIIEQFDYICVADSGYNVDRWKIAYPNKKIIPVTWHSPRFEFIDKDISNPYTDNKFKIVYFGIIIERYLEIFKRLANDGEEIYISGHYYNPNTKKLGNFTEEEKASFPNKLHLIGNGSFTCGEQFRYLRYADLGLAMTEGKNIGALRHKTVEYLVCGTRVLVEETIANGHKVLDLHAGFVFPFNNYDILYKLIQYEKQNKYNKEELKEKARKIFDMKLVCNQILKA